MEKDTLIYILGFCTSAAKNKTKTITKQQQQQQQQQQNKKHVIWIIAVAFVSITSINFEASLDLIKKYVPIKAFSKLFSLLTFKLSYSKNCCGVPWNFLLGHLSVKPPVIIILILQDSYESSLSIDKSTKYQ